MIDIARDNFCSRQCVYKKLIEFNIPLRTKKEASRLVYDKKKIVYKRVNENGNERIVVPGSLEIDEAFFKTWSNEMACVLGVIYTDGYLFCDQRRGIYRFTLGQKEPEPIVFYDFVKEYLQWDKANKKDFTYTKDIFVMRGLEREFHGKPIQEITTWEIEKWKMKRRKTCKPGSVNRELSLLKHLLSKAMK